MHRNAHLHHPPHNTPTPRTTHTFTPTHPTFTPTQRTRSTPLLNNTPPREAVPDTPLIPGKNAAPTRPQRGPGHRSHAHAAHSPTAVARRFPRRFPRRHPQRTAARAGHGAGHSAGHRRRRSPDPDTVPTPVPYTRQTLHGGHYPPLSSTVRSPLGGCSAVRLPTGVAGPAGRVVWLG